eukprot:6207162-Pleurochrysis_carterae.AAC.5
MPHADSTRAPQARVSDVTVPTRHSSGGCTRAMLLLVAPPPRAKPSGARQARILSQRHACRCRCPARRKRPFSRAQGGHGTISREIRMATFAGDFCAHFDRIDWAVDEHVGVELHHVLDSGGHLAARHLQPPGGAPRSDCPPARPCRRRSSKKSGCAAVALAGSSEDEAARKSKNDGWSGGQEAQYQMSDCNSKARRGGGGYEACRERPELKATHLTCACTLLADSLESGSGERVSCSVQESS